jgi:hypothetical protein
LQIYLVYMNALRKSPLGGWIYDALLKRNSTYLVVILVGAITYEAAINRGVEWLWTTANKGRLWEDFKKNQLPLIQARKNAEAEE